MNKYTHVRRGVTLIELVVSMSIASLVLLGIGSSMVLASRALPSSSNKLSQSIASYKILEKMSNEISVAQSFTLASLNAIEFTVADRDANAVAETIRYEWSGVLGDPLTRKYNLLPAVTVLENVNRFEMAFDIDAAGGAGGGAGTTDRPFTLFSSIDIDAGATEFSYNITDTTWLSQYVVPDPAILPANTTKWKLDQVVFRGKNSGKKKGITNVELRNDSGNGRPNTTAIESVQLLESSLGKNWTAATIDYTLSPWLNPDQGICVTLTPVIGSDPVTSVILYQQPSVARTNVKLFTSNDAGGAWVQVLSTTLTGFYVYGTARINNNAGLPPATNKLNTVTIELQIDGGTNMTHATSTNVLNHPSVTVQ